MLLKMVRVLATITNMQFQLLVIKMMRKVQLNEITKLASSLLMA